MEEIRQYVRQTVEANNQSAPVQAVSRKGTLRRVVGICPKCGCNVIESDKSFYCDGFRQEHKCNFTLWKNNKYLQVRGVTLTAELAGQLLETGSMQINDLVSKSGNHYNAIFYMEPGPQYVNFRMEFAPKTVSKPASSQSEQQSDSTQINTNQENGE